MAPSSHVDRATTHRPGEAADILDEALQLLRTRRKAGEIIF